MAAWKQSNYGVSCQHTIKTVLILALRIIILVMIPFKTTYVYV